MAITEGLSPADFSALMGDRDGFGGNGAWWIIILFLFMWGRNGYGNDGVQNGYTLASDFATLQRQMSDGFNSQERRTDSIINGICDLGYANLQQSNGINQNVSNIGFGLQNAIQQNGYEDRLATQNLSSQLSSCCCNMTSQIDRGFADTNYNMATQNCATLQAIDKVGDRVIDYLTTKENQTLRDENFTLKLAASQQAQNNYLVGQLGQKVPIPAYLSYNPNAAYNGCPCANF